MESASLSYPLINQPRQTSGQKTNITMKKLEMLTMAAVAIAMHLPNLSDPKVAEITEEYGVNRAEVIDLVAEMYAAKSAALNDMEG